MLPPENPTTTKPAVKASPSLLQDMAPEPHRPQQVLVEHLRTHRVEHHVTSALRLTASLHTYILRLDLLFEHGSRLGVNHREMPFRILLREQSLQKRPLAAPTHDTHGLSLTLCLHNYRVVVGKTQFRCC